MSSDQAVGESLSRFSDMLGSLYSRLTSIVTSGNIQYRTFIYFKEFEATLYVKLISFPMILYDNSDTDTDRGGGRGRKGAD